MFDYYIVGQRQTRSTPAQGCLIEFEDVIANGNGNGKNWFNLA